MDADDPLYTTVTVSCNDEAGAAGEDDARWAAAAMEVQQFVLNELKRVGFDVC